MRILVTGGAGYIGSHTVRLLLARGHDVFVYDNLSAGHRSAVPQDRLIQGDLRDGDLLDQTLVVKRIEGIVHFAASCYVGESVTDPGKYYLNNLINSAHLLERVRKHGISRFVFSSTCATYGLPTAVPITESEKQLPINPYGNTKLAFERMLSDYAPAYGIGYVALRYFNAAGASEDSSIGEDHEPETHLIPNVLRVALGQQSHVDVFGTDYPTPDGTCIRDYIHVEDLGQAHVLALETIQPGIGRVYNVGTGTGNSVREVIETAEAVTGRTIAVKEGPRRPGDPPSLVASAEKITRELGWKPRFPSIRAIIETAWNWHLSHPQGYGD